MVLAWLLGRWNTIRAATKGWRILLVIWVLVGSWNTIRGELLPKGIADKLPNTFGFGLILSESIALAWWLVGFAVIAILASIEYAHRIQPSSANDAMPSPVAKVASTRSETVAPQSRASDRILAPYDPEKDALLRKLFSILQRSLADYDFLGDRIASPWKDILLRDGRDAYREKLQHYRRTGSEAFKELIKTIDDNRIFVDIYDKFGGATAVYNATFESAGNLYEKIGHLPPRPEATNLPLIKLTRSRSVVQWGNTGNGYGVTLT